MSRLQLLRVLAAPALGLLLTLAGCSEPEPSPSTSKQRAGASPPPAAVKLTVLVAGDEQLAEGVRLLRGEWKARSGGELAVSSMALPELADAESLQADVIIFPSRWLGALAERNALRPMRELILDAPELGLADIFPAIREGEMKYGGQTFALPLGSPPLMLCRAAPAETIGADATAPTSTPAVVYPSTDAAAAYVLIARALGYTESTRRAEAMFHPETMAPRISDAPWVRALTEIIEQREARRDQPPLNFAEAIKAVFIGQAPATLGWPSLLNQDDDAPAADSITVVEFTPLPTAEQVYSTTRQDWENQLHPQPVTLLGFEGRLVAVTEIGRNAVSAFKLAQWLACGDVAVQLSSRSDATLWYRQSQASAHTRWTGGKQRIAESPPVTEQVAHLLETENPLLIPRIPGIDEYLGALADAVRSAAPGEVGAQAALEAAAAKWEEITEQLGREEQAGAYRRHLGIEPFP